MSDQVEIVAAEDAPNNTETGEPIEAVQKTSKKPQAIKPEADARAESNVQEAAEADEPLVDGPVGEVLEDGRSDEAEVSTVVLSGSESAKATSEEVEEADEPLVDGPVGEVLDLGNSEDVAESTATFSSDSADESDAATSSDDADGSKGNVRILSVGQQVQGTVKRIADFGAFVDIGVGRDGLIHISELSVRRVGKVTDVLAEGQEITAWIKKLDRDRNRISLTLIDPNTKTIRDLNKDDLVQGTVTRILPYGAFVDIGIGRDALLHVHEMGVGYVAKPEDVVKVGDSIEARIIELSRRRGHVDLSLKGLHDEPEPTPAPQPEQSQPHAQVSHSRRQAEPEAAVEEEDNFEDLDVLSPMELAFKRAMEAEGMEVSVGRKKQGKRNRRENDHSLQDDIISRTLNTGRK